MEQRKPRTNNGERKPRRNGQRRAPRREEKEFEEEFFSGQDDFFKDK